MICTAVRGQNLEEFLGALNNSQKTADLVELELDSLWPQLGNELLQKLDFIWAVLQKPCVVSLHGKKSGGLYTGDRALKFSILNKALVLGASYVDCEYQEEHTEQLPYEKTICSWQNFKLTPALDDLKLLTEKMATAGKLSKITCQLHEYADFLTLCRLAHWQKEQQQKFVLLGLGKFGILLNALMPVLGAEFTYGQASELYDLWGVQKIDMDFKLCGTFGYPLTHAKSPALHQAYYREHAIKALYLLFETASAREAVETIRLLNMPQSTITAPLKEAVIPLLDELKDVALELQAVNTVMQTEGKLSGYNTDFIGFQKMLEQNKIELKNQTVCLLGAGGAAKVVAKAARLAECRHLIVLNRTLAKAENLAQSFNGAADTLNNLKNYQYDILIDATSIALDSKAELAAPWMREDVNFHKEQTVISLNYTESYLLAKAKAAGARTLNGEDMLRFQAEEQHKLWRG